jgi:hypothetical protein
MAQNYPPTLIPNTSHLLWGSTDGTSLLMQSFWLRYNTGRVRDIANVLYTGSNRYSNVSTVLDDSDKKPWETLNTCTNTLWKLGGTGAGSSLQALCVSLGIPISKVDMVGDEVGREYFRGNIEGITDYCNKDAIATFNVLRRFKYEAIFNFDDVIYLDSITQPSESYGNELHKLAITKEFTQDIKDALIARFRGKKVTKKEFGIL